MKAHGWTAIADIVKEWGGARQPQKYNVIRALRAEDAELDAAVQMKRRPGKKHTVLMVPDSMAERIRARLVEKFGSPKDAASDGSASQGEAGETPGSVPPSPPVTETKTEGDPIAEVQRADGPAATPKAEIVHRVEKTPKRVRREQTEQSETGDGLGALSDWFRRNWLTIALGLGALVVAVLFRGRGVGAAEGGPPPRRRTPPPEALPLPTIEQTVDPGSGAGSPVLSQRAHEAEQLSRNLGVNR